MDARDFRGIGRPAQEELRRRALFLIEHEGMTQAQAARAVGVHRQTVNIWHKRYREWGEAGLLDGRRVSPRRGKGLLTAEEVGKVRGWIAEGAPDAVRGGDGQPAEGSLQPHPARGVPVLAVAAAEPVEPQLFRRHDRAGLRRHDPPLYRSSEGPLSAAELQVPDQAERRQAAALTDMLGALC